MPRGARADGCGRSCGSRCELAGESCGAPGTNSGCPVDDLWMTKESWTCRPKALVPRVRLAVELHSPLKADASLGRLRERGKGRATGASRGHLASAGDRAARGHRAIGEAALHGTARPLHLIHGGASFLLRRRSRAMAACPVPPSRAAVPCGRPAPPSRAAVPCRRPARPSRAAVPRVCRARRRLQCETNRDAMRSDGSDHHACQLAFLHRADPRRPPGGRAVNAARLPDRPGLRREPRAEAVPITGDERADGPDHRS